MLGQCQAAHVNDHRPCDTRPDLVVIVDAYGDCVSGCRRHGAQLLANVQGARVYPLAGDDRDAVACALAAQRRTPFDFRDEY
jgi:hypothetical protein